MTRCARCGKETPRPELFFAEGERYAVEVCPECDLFLTTSDRASARFSVLLRAQDKLAKSGSMPEVKKTNGGP